jgi:hypothetical protein
MDSSSSGSGPDVIGRVMSLEQKTKGLYGRISAIEMRISMEQGEAQAYDTLEFIQGERPASKVTAMSLENRVATLESALEKNKKIISPGNISMLDVTGLVIGISALSIGFLLFIGSTDILRSPLLAFAAGTVILVCSVGRMVIKK